MTEENLHRLEAAFRSSTPPETLRDYALELSGNGLKRTAVYAIFREMLDHLESEGRETERGCIEIILDSITHFMSPSNNLYLDLPE